MTTPPLRPQPDPPTIAALLSDAITRLAAAGVPSARLDAELLLGTALGVDRAGILAHPGALVGAAAAAAFDALLARREAGEPVAYLRGFREFHGVVIATDPRALIPRPETELLVDAAIAEVAARLTRAPRPPGAPPLRIADVGTGTGAIAVALIAALRKRRMDEHVEVTAADISPDALDLARENAAGHGVADRMRFWTGDLLPVDGDAYALVCANLPYVATGDLVALARDLAHEPPLALDGGPDGLDVVRRLLGLLPILLAPEDGVALLEIGADQGGSIVEAVEAQLPGWTCHVSADLAGLPRLARVTRPAGGEPTAGDRP